jgi:hypothetical protein
MATWDQGSDASRLSIFENLQDHPEPELRELALLEIDKAPYDQLRRMDIRIPVDSLLGELWTPQGYPYQPIRVLLLGLSGDDAARREMREFVERVDDWDWAENLGAFATALIELDGAAGIALLDDRMLSDLGQPLDKLEQIIEALAIHSGVGSDEIRSEISTVLDRLVRSRPEAAPLVARQFGNRQDWTMAGNLGHLVAERKFTTASDLMTVAIYLAQAKAALDDASPGTKGG